MDSIGGAIKGLGATMHAMLISLVCGCGIRLFWIFTIFRIEEYHTLKSLLISYPISWFITGIAYLLVFFSVLKKIDKKSKETKKMLSSANTR
jgi:Na+-driven multidrug efflux pump